MTKSSPTLVTSVSEPGTFQFEKRGILVKESIGNAQLSIVRQNGADGDVTGKYSYSLLISCHTTIPISDWSTQNFSHL